MVKRHARLRRLLWSPFSKLNKDPMFAGTKLGLKVARGDRKARAAKICDLYNYRAAWMRGLLLLICDSTIQKSPCRTEVGEGRREADQWGQDVSVARERGRRGREQKGRGERVLAGCFRQAADWASGKRGIEEGGVGRADSWAGWFSTRPCLVPKKFCQKF